jgi:uncharacterized protein YdaU (DUF1376 family)
MHWYPHHIGDYRSATAYLTNEQDLAYRRLLEMYYDTENPIPLETQSVSRRLRVGADALQLVLDDFFVRTESGWKHARCDQEIMQFNRKAEVARANGAKGGRRKSLPAKQKNPAGYPLVSQKEPIGNPEQTQTLANQQPTTNNQQKKLSFASWQSAPSAEVVRDWSAMRKAKRAPVSQTVIDRLAPEINAAVAAGYTADDCLSLCVLRGWQGFKFQWLLNDNREENHATRQRPARQTRDERDRRALADYLDGLEEDAGAGVGDPAQPAAGV